MTLTFISAQIIAYLAGSIPFGLLIGRWVGGVDLRRHGSGNIGATNVFRVVGKKWGLFALFLDALKGAFAVSIPPLIFALPRSVPLSLSLGIAAILGHSFPVWLKFKGGKGVATSLGVFMAIAPAPTLTSFAIWALSFAAWRIISLASLIAALVFPVTVFLMCRQYAGFAWLMTLSSILPLFIFYTHRANIRRILRGEEKRLI